ncbi:MAG: methionine synthase, partial [Shinella sp.]|nr:methionine synthase [Shinella sp.]
FVAANDADYADIRTRHRNRGDAKRLVSLDKARGQKFDGGWDGYVPPAPNRPGVHAFEDWPLDDLLPVLDWTPFFQAWELAGKYPAILTDEVVGKQASELYRDAQAMLEKIIAGKWLTARAVYGIWPASSRGDDVVLQHGSGEATLHFLRQQVDKPVEADGFAVEIARAQDEGDGVGEFLRPAQ